MTLDYFSVFVVMCGPKL